MTQGIEGFLGGGGGVEEGAVGAIYLGVFS